MHSLTWHTGRGQAHPQQGAAFLWMVALLLGATLILAGSLRSRVAQHLHMNFNRDQSTYLDDVLNNAKLWYQREAPTLELSGNTPSESEILQKIAPDHKYGLRAQVSNQLGLPCAASAFGTCVPYRVIAIWLPPISAADTSSFNPSNGSFTADPAILSAGTGRLFNTMAYQQGLMVQMNETLKLTASRIQNFARAQQNLSGLTSFENFLRVEDCAHPNTMHLPCVDAYTPITSTTIPSMLGLADSDFMTPWGDVIQISNLVNSNNTALPYSLSLQATSPWGQTAVLQVQQAD